MKLDSKYFDSIRISKSRKKDKGPEKKICEWPECSHVGAYRAPKTRAQGGGYALFCLEHVKEYNKNYTAFAPGEASAQDASGTSWQRPTWRLGENMATGKIASQMAGMTSSAFMRDRKKAASASPHRRTPQKTERKALETLGFSAEMFPDTEEVKNRYKALVKQFHPDTNGGCRDMEDRFREIVQAYDCLKRSGFCP